MGDVDADTDGLTLRLAVKEGDTGDGVRDGDSDCDAARLREAVADNVFVGVTALALTDGVSE